MLPLHISVMLAFKWLAVVRTKIFGISVLVGEHDCDKQPSYEYCEEGIKWF